ncbi:DUF6333 family protein [Streptomyces acidicola]|uniref:DUF6333 family protein n=1 Tax=Streptomyces acidicola TaxID=2596892 RepID=UPI003445F3AA
MPEAKIIGGATVDCGETHEETVWLVPGFELVHSEGWPGEDDDTPRWTLKGDPQAVLDACRGTAQRANDADVPYDPDHPTSTYWGGLGELILGAHRPWRRRKVRTSVFGVPHTRSDGPDGRGLDLRLGPTLRAATRAPGPTGPASRSGSQTGAGLPVPVPDASVPGAGAPEVGAVRVCAVLAFRRRPARMR